MQDAMTAGMMWELLLFVVCMAPVVYVDARERRIPDLWLLLAAAGLLGLRLARGTLSLSHVIGSGVSVALLLGVRFLFQGRLGLGDVKLAALIGFLLGFPGCLVAVFVASAVGILFVRLRQAAAGIPRGRCIAFAPFLVPGAVAAYLLQSLLEAFWGT